MLAALKASAEQELSRPAHEGTPRRLSFMESAWGESGETLGCKIASKLLPDARKLIPNRTNIEKLATMITTQT